MAKRRKRRVISLKMRKQIRRAMEMQKERRQVFAQDLWGAIPKEVRKKPTAKSFIQASAAHHIGRIPIPFWSLSSKTDPIAKKALKRIHK